MESLPRRWIHALASVQSYRETRPRSKAIIETPVVQHGVHKTVVSYVRQVIGESAGEVVPDVEIGVSTLVAELVVF